MNGMRSRTTLAVATVGAAVAAAVACGAPPATPPATGAVATAAAPFPTARDALREEARATLVRWCAQCHVSSRPSDQPDALLVFDLDEPEWAARMTGAQLDQAIRLAVEERNPHDTMFSVMSAAEREGVARFLRGERERRPPASF
jgi:hypothetical protein